MLKIGYRRKVRTGVRLKNSLKELTKNATDNPFFDLAALHFTQYNGDHEHADKYATTSSY